MTPLLAPSSAKIRRERFPSKDAISRFDCARQQAQSTRWERLNLCRIDFRFLNSPEQRWHRRPDAAQGADHCRQPPLLVT
jgi:hypothetical protein